MAVICLPEIVRHFDEYIQIFVFKYLVFGRTVSFKNNKEKKVQLINRPIGGEIIELTTISGYIFVNLLSNFFAPFEIGILKWHKNTWIVQII